MAKYNKSEIDDAAESLAGGKGRGLKSISEKRVYRRVQFLNQLFFFRSGNFVDFYATTENGSCCRRITLSLSAVVPGTNRRPLHSVYE